MKERRYNPEKVSYVDYGFRHPAEMVMVAYADDINISVGVGRDYPRKYRVLKMDKLSNRFLLEDVSNKQLRNVTFHEISYAARVK